MSLHYWTPADTVLTAPSPPVVLTAITTERDVSACYHNMSVEVSTPPASLSRIRCRYCVGRWRADLVNSSVIVVPT